MHMGNQSSSVRRRTILCAGDARPLHSVAFLLLSICILHAMPRATYADNAGQLILTEVMIDPRATSDQYGEWIEIANLGDAPIELLHWSLEIEEEPQEFAQPYLLAPGRYVVVARNMDPAVNGGVTADLALARIRLPNEHGAIRLLSPSGQLEDALMWGGDVGLLAPEGASLERQGTSRQDSWQAATQRWPGSAGDRGNPGLPYAPPTPTPEPTQTDAPTALPTPTSAPVPPTPTEIATAPPAPPHIRLSELMANPATVPDEIGEWIELFNAGAFAVNLRGWQLADLDTDAHLVNSDLWIQPGEYLVLGRNADPASNGGAPVRYLYDGIAIANETDELLLFAPWGEEVDRLQWGEGTSLHIAKGASLERTGFDPGHGWTVAWQPWPGSLGDFGSPGAAYQPSPPTATHTPTAPHTPTVAPPTLTPTPTAHPHDAPHIRLSELMANPAAVPDESGEWIELFNADAIAVNLRGWRLADLDTDAHLVNSDLWIQPGEYLVLGRNADPASNGGAPCATSMTGLQSPTKPTNCCCSRPWGEEVDRLQWGEGTSLQIAKGASLERTGFNPGHGWTVAWQPWPGSLGDYGSPGAAYTPRPATPTPTSASTAIASPTAMAAFAPVWPAARTQAALAIDEVYADGSEHEFVAIANLGDDPVNLEGWSLGDAETPGDNEGLYTLPGGATLKPGALFVVARNASAFRGRWGYDPNAEWEDSDPTVPTLIRLPDRAAGSLALNDTGDEVLLLNPALELADAVAWGDGSYASVRLGGNLQLRDGYSLQRVPGFRYQPHSDVRHRFMAAPPQPAAMRAVPTASLVGHPVVGDDKIAVWGSLGARSNFSAGGQAPPHWIAAVAAAGGLDYIAIADDDVAHPRETVRALSNIIVIPAWRWHNADGAGAVVYADAPETLQTWGDLRSYLDEHECTAQAQVKEPPAIQRLSAIGSDHVNSDRPSVLLPTWQTAGRPLIPAGNALPVSDGLGEDAPRHTGLAVERLDEHGVSEAVAARRGWLTSSVGLWLTLRTQQGDWMGQTVATAGILTLEVQYGDQIRRNGRAVAMAE